jgi:L-fucose isomerase-like protein
VTAAAIAVGRPTFDLDFAATRVDDAWEVLSRLGIELLGRRGVIVADVDEVDGELDSIASCEVIVVLQATFTDSSLTGRIAERTGAPVLVWSFPEERTGGRLRLNSLCGANLAAYLLRRRRHPAVFVHADPAGTGALDRVRAAVLDLASPPTSGPSLEHPPVTPTSAQPSPAPAPSTEREEAAFVGRTIGVIGDPPTGFEPCIGDDAALFRTTGIAVERIGLSELFAAADGVAPHDRAAISDRMHAALTIEPDVAAAGMDQSVGLFGGLTALAARHGWSAVATRCWPECMTEYGAAACTPMAMLTEDGVPSVCEADLYGAATALILRHVADSDPFVADLVDADVTDDTSVVWHCGVAPISLADPHDVPVGITHPNRHRAMVNQFALRPGRVTLARLSQAGGDISMVVGSGTVLDRPRPFSGTCATLRWDHPASAVLETVFGRGLEHHVGLVYGDHRARIEELAAGWGLSVVVLGEH